MDTTFRWTILHYKYVGMYIKIFIIHYVYDLRFDWLATCK